MSTSTLRQLVTHFWALGLFALLFLYRLLTDPAGLVQWLLWMPFVIGALWLLSRRK